MNQAYAEAFERFTKNGGGAGPAELLGLRREAFEHFARTGFPTTKDEEWRFTPVAPITGREWRLSAEAKTSLVTPADIAPFRFGPPAWCTLVFVDGRFEAGLSHQPKLPRGLSVEPLSQALEADPALLSKVTGTSFSALNAAFVKEGVSIRVSAGVELADPIHILSVASKAADGASLNTRIVLHVERGARAQLVESYAGLFAAASFTNAVTQVTVEAGAWVEHSRIQRESESAYHIGLTQVDQARDSHYRSFTLAMGGAIARHDLRARLGDENVETLLYGLYLGRREQLIDNHTAIFHDHPNCRSWEVYKGILDDASHAVFNGKVFVTPEAQKTDAKQTNRNLLLSDRAKVDTKPQLEIFADDVKCTHGATVGRLDEIAHFYLQSRGVPREAAQQLLTYAFAAEVMAEVTSAPVRERLDGLVRERLGVSS
ncbi:MAG: Fe-S cluster assembly protein SufD [Gemmatimonadales bacterium]|nr:Fe-S cluster assembly protein SufD [Gemmatimonadales bacterium]